MSTSLLYGIEVREPIKFSSFTHEIAKGPMFKVSSQKNLILSLLFMIVFTSMFISKRRNTDQPKPLKEESLILTI